MELYKLTGHELLEKIENKEITSEQIFLDLDERIKEVDAKVKAYVRIDRTKDFAKGKSSAGIFHSGEGVSMQKKRMLIIGVSGLLGNNFAFCFY